MLSRTRDFIITRVGMSRVTMTLPVRNVLLCPGWQSYTLFNSNVGKMGSKQPTCKAFGGRCGNVPDANREEGRRTMVESVEVDGGVSAPAVNGGRLLAPVPL